MWSIHCKLSPFPWISAKVLILVHSLQRDERVLIVWSDELDQIIPLSNEFEEKIMKHVWRTRTHEQTPSLLTSASNSSYPSATASNVNLAEKPRGSVTVAEAAAATAVLAEREKTTVSTSPAKKFWGWGWKLSSEKSSKGASDPEKASSRQARPIRLFAPLYGGLGSGLALCAS